MTPKKSSIIALCLVGIAVGIGLLNRMGNGDPSTPDGIAAEGRRHPMETREDRKEREAREALALVERDKVTSLWMGRASDGFGQTKRHLVTDLGIDAETSGEVEKVFAKRERELASLLAAMTSGEAGDDREIFSKICALIRNKGLREDLAGVLSKEQLAAFDAREAKRGRETVEARAYRDMADINAVVQLTDSQKQEVLGALMQQAPRKLEQEADARAFMSLTFGPLAAEMESSAFRGLTNMVAETMKEGSADIDIYGVEYRKLVEEQKAERIGNELSSLRHILNETQLTRYREHLEAEPGW